MARRTKGIVNLQGNDRTSILLDPGCESVAIGSLTQLCCGQLYRRPGTVYNADDCGGTDCTESLPHCQKKMPYSGGRSFSRVRVSIRRRNSVEHLGAFVRYYSGDFTTDY